MMQQINNNNSDYIDSNITHNHKLHTFVSDGKFQQLK